MLRFIFVLFVITMFTNCDPVVVMDANINNMTSQRLTVLFFSSVVPNDTLVIAPEETLLFQEGFDIGNTYLAPYMGDFDSVHIINSSEEVLKVYTPTTKGKNIFDVKESWIETETSKRVFKFLYEIKNEDVE